MDWYVPLTVLPSIGLIIMSTSAQMMSLSSEVGSLVQREECPQYNKIIQSKIRQLKRLVISLVLLYAASGSFIFAGLVEFIAPMEISEGTAKVVLGFGTFLFLFALLVLTFYACVAVRIRQTQFLVHSKSS